MVPPTAISTILDLVDSGQWALPEFQRGYVWNRDQVRRLFDSLYRDHPVGGLLVWATGSQTTALRGTAPAAEQVTLLLDGQQRITSLYGVLRGTPPPFFEGDSRAFTGLRFHIEHEVFEFYQPVKMRDDPLWLDVTEMTKDESVLDRPMFKAANKDFDQFTKWNARLAKLKSIKGTNLTITILTHNSLDVVVEIFNKVNSGGTKLSKGDLALAKICAEWPDARNAIRSRLDEWDNYNFTRDWLLRSVSTVVTGEAQFRHLHGLQSSDIENGLKRASEHIDWCLNHISSRFGLDHDRVFFGRFAIPVMARYLERRSSNPMDERERDKLLFWYVQAAMWGRFSASTETTINQDIDALEREDGGLDRLLEQLRLSRGTLRAVPEDFGGWSKGARFYPVLYLLTRMGEARDFGTGLELKSSLRGKMNKLEVHHIFPRARLSGKYSRSEVNALGNFCFLTKDSNLRISARPPEEYLSEVAKQYPGALESQWIPQDRDLWHVDRFKDFLAARQELLAKELNDRMESLLHDDTRWLVPATAEVNEQKDTEAIGTVEDANEEAQIQRLNEWIKQKGLHVGEVDYDFSDPQTGQPKAVFDLAWPDGIQMGKPPPVAVLLDKEMKTLEMASQGGFRAFTSVREFHRYVERDILGEDLAT